jgi:phospholipase/carboxylesterase
MTATVERRHPALPPRRGVRPETRPYTPHQQLSQNAPVELQQTLWARMVALEGVLVGRSTISAPDTRALHLPSELADGPDNAFLSATEFAHLHGAADGSLHMCLPETLAVESITQKWAEQHPLARQGMLPSSVLMVYGPRDPDELDVVWQLVQASYEHARKITRA